MTDTTAVTRGFEFKTEGENTGILSFIDAMRELIARTQGKDTDTMILRAGGMQAMLLNLMGMAAFLVVTRNEELANILSDTAGFNERQDVADIGNDMDAAFADDGTLGLMGLLIGVQSDNYDSLVAEAKREAADALVADGNEGEADAPVLEDTDEDEDDSDMSDYDSDDDYDDDWDDYEDDDDFEDDEDD